MTKSIPLTKGKFALVDDEDYEWLSKEKWCFTGRYAIAAGKRKNKPSVLMHRLIVKTPKGMETDHINHDRLDNRKENLRICTHSENMRNQLKNSKNKTGYKGVRFLEYRISKNPWNAYIKINHQFVNLGFYSTPEDAARKYDQAAKELFGDFALLNLA
jgi:hypothetical protein